MTGTKNFITMTLLAALLFEQGTAARFLRKPENTLTAEEGHNGHHQHHKHHNKHHNNNNKHHHKHKHEQQQRIADMELATAHIGHSDPDKPHNHHNHQQQQKIADMELAAGHEGQGHHKNKGHQHSPAAAAEGDASGHGHRHKNKGHHNKHKHHNKKHKHNNNAHHNHQAVERIVDKKNPVHEQHHGNIFDKKDRLSKPQQPLPCDPAECEAVVSLFVDTGAFRDPGAVSFACDNFCAYDGSFTKTVDEGVLTLGGPHLLQLGQEAGNLKIALLGVFLESGCGSSDLTCFNHVCGTVQQGAEASMEFELACSVLAMEYGPLLVEKGSFPAGEAAMAQASQETTEHVCGVLFGGDEVYAEEHGVSCSTQASSSVIRD